MARRETHVVMMHFISKMMPTSRSTAPTRARRSGTATLSCDLSFNGGRLVVAGGHGGERRARPGRATPSPGWRRSGGAKVGARVGAVPRAPPASVDAASGSRAVRTSLDAMARLCACCRRSQPAGRGRAAPEGPLRKGQAGARRARLRTAVTVAIPNSSAAAAALTRVRSSAPVNANGPNQPKKSLRGWVGE